MKHKLFILVLIVFVSGKLYAQDMFALTYSTSLGTGNLHDYISKYSFRGVAFDYRRGLQDKNIAIGFSGAWNVFYERKDYDSYTFKTVTATGKQYRYTNAFPIMGTIDYTGRTASGMQWFVGLGIGTTYLERITDFGSYRFTTDTWQFLLSPEVGISYPVVDENAVYLSARYNQNFDDKELKGQPYFSINVGLSWGSFVRSH